MLELTFTIVILGIVSSIGAEIIAKVYQSYILQRAQHRATIQTELVATQIANRLSAAISGTILRRTAKSGGTIEDIDDDMSLDGDSYTILQWVGSDVDSFNADTIPGWSGFCDLNQSNPTTIITPGSDLNFTNTIQANLGNTGKFAIYFPYDTTAYFATGEGETITLDTNVSHIVEHYKVSWSSYALVVEDNPQGAGKDLNLYYNFSPVRGVNISGSVATLMKDISTFKFTGSGKTIRFKVCKEEPIGENFNVTACKEKVVF